MTAVRAAGTGETVGKDAAFEVTAEFAFGQCRGMAATAVSSIAICENRVFLQNYLRKYNGICENI